MMTEMCTRYAVRRRDKKKYSRPGCVSYIVYEIAVRDLTGQ
jgi:hypothetical protein